MVERILSDVCRHFRFGCGFVYESDYTGTFFLKEYFFSYHARPLPESFTLEEHLNAREMGVLVRTSFFHHRHSDEAGGTPLGIFASNAFMLVPCLDRETGFLGLVGMMDRRRNILLDDQAVGAAKTVLNLLANHVKLRVYQRRLELARNSLTTIFDNTGVDIYVNDFATHEILYANKSMAKPYGGVDKLLGKACWAAFYDDKEGECDYCPQKQLIDENGNPTKIYSWDYQRPFDGAWFRVLSAAFRWVDGRLAHVVSSVDITENKRNEATIAQMANYDVLTNLPNRRKLMRDCREAMNGDRRPAPGGFLLFFDLDNFKKLNDSMGHQAGDELLAEVGRALQQEPLTRNKSYRYGGDEFIVLLSGADRDCVLRAVNFLLERFDKPWTLRGVSPVCRASIGVARYPDDAITPEDLLRKADEMMYQAKRHGRSMACFHDGECVRTAPPSPMKTPPQTMRRKTRAR
jgi:diguanylate cyclase (GGDEF)-like protein